MYNKFRSLVYASTAKTGIQILSGLPETSFRIVVSSVEMLSDILLTILVHFKVFRALQDIKSTRGNKGVLITVNEACRVVKKNGTVAIADESFPECKPKGDQGRLFNAIKRYWRHLLPSTKDGISQVKVLSYDPKESLLPKDAERELRLSVEWVKPFGVRVDFDNFWKEAGEVVKKQGRISPEIIVLLGIKA